jgi:CxxC motif-containing protein (DUF1111 family)
MVARSVSSRLFTAVTVGLTAAISIFAQQPAPPPPPPVGGPHPLRGLTPGELASFQEGIKRFNEIDSVTGTQPGAPGSGLGPRFNLNSCVGCHAQPTVGGTSPAVNPQFAAASDYGATNVVPSFIHQNGPVRVVRFVSDGGVHSLFTISGRRDAVGCNIAQPNFEAAAAQGDAVFRIPTPLFGAGLIESITDSTILANKSANADAKTSFGIAGHENRNTNDGMITRFGWKAQNRSLLLFSGEAYNVEVGVTNELFQTERDETAGCAFNATPEDRTNFEAATPVLGMSDILGFESFMRWLAPLQPQPQTASTQRGEQAFTLIGCALCHTPSFTTGMSTSPSLSQKQANLYSDLLVHHMGTGLADGIVQGAAAGDEFRSAPLWGLGARLFFLHDGRTDDLTQTIQEHQSSGSEANGSIAAFNALTAQTKTDLLNFLKSL